MAQKEVERRETLKPLIERRRQEIKLLKEEIKRSKEEEEKQINENKALELLIDKNERSCEGLAG